MPLLPKPRFTDTEVETQRASSEKARHAGALLDAFEGLPSAGARADLVEYYKHLGDWARGSGMNPSEFDGVSGASVGSGRTLKVSVELADTLIDAGYQIRIDSAVEDKRDVRADVSVPLTSKGAGKPAAGSTYVESFTYDL